MKILFDSTSLPRCRIFYAISEEEWKSNFPYKYENGKYWVLHIDTGELNCHVGLDLFQLDDIGPYNNRIQADIRRGVSLTDIDNNFKWAIVDDNGDWKLDKKDNWVEAYEE